MPLAPQGRKVSKIQISSSKKFPGALALSKLASFDRSVVRKCIALDTNLPCGQLYGQGIFNNDGTLQNRSQTPADFLEGLRPGVDAVHICAETVQADDVKKARDKNIDVLVWFPGVVRTVKENIPFLLELERMGVSMVCTNDPLLFDVEPQKEKDPGATIRLPHDQEEGA